MRLQEIKDYNHAQRIGTSNIVLPGPKNTFPEVFKNKPRLSYYASLFNTVELNSPFYKVPQPSTFERWSQEVPEGFEFTVKLWKGITHNKEWKPADVDQFMRAVNALGDKKGCLLIQFPASIKIEYFDQAGRILKTIMDTGNAGQWKKAVEFRDQSWYTKKTYQMLDHYNASIVLHDMPASGTRELNGKADFVYLRFHGEKGDYAGDYSPALLQQTARCIEEWKQQGKQVYVYFNNTIGNAFENALHLQRLCNSAIA